MEYNKYSLQSKDDYSDIAGIYNNMYIYTNINNRLFRIENNALCICAKTGLPNVSYLTVQYRLLTLVPFVPYRTQNVPYSRPKYT